MSGSRPKRSSQPTSTMSAGSDLILDAVLKEAGQDRFDHEAIAGVVADLTLNATPPVNIALFGPWGSGKSSFLGLLDKRLRASNQAVEVATYDAWKYGGRALKKHFVGSVAEQLGLGGEDFEKSLSHDQESVRLDLWTWIKENKKSLAVGALMALVLSVAWFFLVSLIIWAVNWDAGFSKATQVAVTTVGTVLSLGFAALLFGPKVLESAVVKVKEAAPETDDEFAKSFQRLVTMSINVSKGERLVVFIDELDRCGPTDVVATLIDLKTFLDVDGCIFVVAADREVLERALRKVPQANPVRDEDPYYSTPGAFLDKIFQHQIPLPPLRPQALTRFARELVENQDGLWAELRAVQEDDRLFLRVVYGLVPVHVRSPRRVKVLMNNYATTVRIAQARGVNWLQRAEELATLTVLETEFPAVASDLVRFPSLLKYLRDTSLTPTAQNAQTMVDSYLNLLKEPATEQDAAETPVAGHLLVDREHDQAAGRRANKTLVENLLAYLRKIEASGIDDPRPDLLYLQSAGAQEGIDDPDLAEVIDFAADYSASDIVVKFTEQPSAVITTAVRLLAQQADAERGPGRLAITESVCRLTEQLDVADVQAVAPIVAGSVLAEASNPDWPTEATPGALILGVIGASKPLVETLLTRRDADAMAEAGVLGRVASVLTYASADQAELVHTLLGSAYYLHPEPLHDALRATPAPAAQALWVGAAPKVTAALKALATPAPATTSAARAAAADAAELTPDDTAVERFEALLTAVENRTDDQAERLISDVLKLGQGANDANVRAAASDRAEEALNRVANTTTRNEHAMLGLRHSPLSKAAWWAELLTETERAPDGYVVFEHLVDALATSTGDDTDAIARAIPAVIPHVPETELPDAQHWIGVTLGKTVWSTTTLPTAKNRATLYATAVALRPSLTDVDAAKLDTSLATDLVNGLKASTDDEHVEEMLSLARTIAEGVAVAVENLAAQTTTSVATLRLRITAAARGSGTTLTAADILAIDGLEGEKEAFAEWLALKPPLAETLQVLGSITVYTNALDQYARALDIEDRTTLWIDLANRGTNWGHAAFQAIGKHGLNSAAVEYIAKEVAAATQQSQRDALIDRLETAKLIEQPQHRAATDLALQLLGTGIAGDISLAARVAHLTGGAAYGRTVQIRQAFDAAISTKPKALTNKQQECLQQINLMTKPPKKRSKGLRGLLGG
jgi:Cdc6-like AAA superfamily ATPase